jgi:hypothetical protein
MNPYPHIASLAKTPACKRQFPFMDCGTCDGSGQIVVSGRNYLGTDTCPECAEREFTARESVRLAALAAELAELERMWGGV